MFNWLKKLFGITPVETKQEEAVILSKEEASKVTVSKVTEVKSNIPTNKAKPKKQTKKAAKAKAVDLDAMTKKDLLALAKEKGIKANASLSKGELVERINAG